MFWIKTWCPSNLFRTKGWWKTKERQRQTVVTRNCVCQAQKSYKKDLNNNDCSYIFFFVTASTRLVIILSLHSPASI